MNLDAFIALVRKDLVLYFSNRRALIMSVVAPIVIAAFFGYLFGGGDTKTSRIVVALTDLDRSPVSTGIAAALHADTTLDVRDMGRDEAHALVRAGQASAAVTLPAGFGRQAGQALFGGRDKPEINVAYDPSQGPALQVVRGLLAQHVMLTVSQAVFSGASTALGDLREQANASTNLPAERKRDLAAMFDSIARVQQPLDAASASASAASGAGGSGSGSASGGGLAVPYTTRETAASAKPENHYNSFAHSFAGMGVQFVLLMGLDLGIGLLAMRRLGLWKRLRAAPLSKAMLLGSRIASCTLTAIVLIVIIYAVAIAAFGVRIDGSVPGFIAVVVASRCSPRASAC